MDFLFGVCHCTDNLTQALDNADINDDEDTEDVDEYLQGSATSLSNNPTRTLTFVGVQRAKIIFVPCGHSRFCQTCADTCRSVGRKCAVCQLKST